MTRRPDLPARRGIFTGAVLSNRRLCREHFALRLGLEEFPPSSPGQFIQVQCRPVRGLCGARAITWRQGRPPRITQPEMLGREAFLRRPFSIASRQERPGRVELEIIYRVVGEGTRWLSGVGRNRRLSVLGPLGNSFSVASGKGQAALVAGGIGLPPMLYLGQALAEAGKKVVAFLGARGRDLVPVELVPGQAVSRAGRPSLCVARFAQLSIPAAIATDDGSLGFGGMASEAFRNWLNAHLPPPEDIVVYCCGPEAMMQAVAEICLSRRIECQLTMERYMACGMGTCQSCVCKVRAAGGPGWKYKLCCLDGPVFQAEEILWD